MVDFIDKLVEQEQILEQKLAPRPESALSEDEIAIIALKGRDCVECGLPIPPQRLRAVPLAVRCISCQQDFEDGKL